MDELLSWIFIVITFFSIINSIGKKAKKQQAKRGPETQRIDRPQVQRTQKQTVKPVQKPAASMLPDQPAAHQPLQPTPIAPSVHVTHHTDDIFTGSMAMQSTEGYDPCHDDDLGELINPCELAPTEDTAPTTSPLSLDWTGSSLVKAMVMNEILTRKRG